MNAPIRDRPPISIFWRCLYWTGICWLAGGPSFCFALLDNIFRNFALLDDMAGMAIGVMLFAAGYIYLSTTGIARKIEARPVLRKAIRIALIIRCLQSVFTVFVFKVSFPLPIFISDSLCVNIAFHVSREIFPYKDDGLLFYLLFSLIDGLFLHVVMGAMAVVIYPILRWPGVPALVIDPTQFCIKCGYDLHASKDNCPECGTPIRPIPASSKPR